MTRLIFWDVDTLHHFMRAIDREEGDRLVAGWRERGRVTLESSAIMTIGVLERYLPARSV